MILLICQKMWSKQISKCSESLLHACVTSTTSIDNTKWVYSTCHSNLTNGKLRVYSKANKMGIPVKSPCLNLTPLEERLIFLGIRFMQISELPRDGQQLLLSIHGNCVNVPTDVNSFVSTLPRSINESQIIPIKLKRKLSYKHHYQFHSVRPRNGLEASEYLVTTSQCFFFQMSI